MASYTWSAISAAFKNLRGTLSSFKRSKGLELQIYQRTRTCLRYDGRFHSQAMRSLWSLCVGAGGGTLAASSIKMTIGSKSLPEKDPAKVLFLNARDSLRKGNMDEALSVLKIAVGAMVADEKISEKEFVKNYHPIIHETARMLTYLKLYKEAAYLYLAVVLIGLKLSMTITCIYVLEAYLKLAEVHVLNKSYENAEDLQLRVITILQENLADLEAISRNTESSKSQENALFGEIDLRKALLAEALTQLGFSMNRNGEIDQAYKLFTSAYGLLHDKHGSCHHKTMAVMGMMVLMNLQQQEYEVAEKLLKQCIMPCHGAVSLTEDINPPRTPSEDGTTCTNKTEQSQPTPEEAENVEKCPAV